MTGAELTAGDAIVSALLEVNDGVERRVYARTAWQQPPENCLGWWHGTVAARDSGKPAETPREIMLQVFERWQQDATQPDRTYVLAIWLLRRRVLTLCDSAETDDSASAIAAQEMLHVHCPSRGEDYTVRVVPPEKERQLQIQAEMTAILYGKAD